jgi:hypothetical protein
MSSYDLPYNYVDNPEALLRKKQSCAASSSATPPTVEPDEPAPSPSMAKTLRDYSTPTVARARSASCQH